jgi:hypothetical protein
MSSRIRSLRAFQIDGNHTQQLGCPGIMLDGREGGNELSFFNSERLEDN